MGVSDVLQWIGERYGLLPVYALVVTFGAVRAGGVRHLLAMLAIMASVYVVMFRAFDLGAGLDLFGLAERFGLSADIANSGAAVLFVFGLGLAVYGVKRLALAVWRRPH